MWADKVEKNHVLEVTRGISTQRTIIETLLDYCERASFRRATTVCDCRYSNRENKSVEASEARERAEKQNGRGARLRYSVALGEQLRDDDEWEPLFVCYVPAKPR